MKQKAIRRKTIGILLKALQMEGAAFHNALDGREKQLYNLAVRHTDMFVKELDKNVKAKIDVLDKDNPELTKEAHDVFMDEMAAQLLEVVYLLADLNTAYLFVQVLEETMKNLSAEE